MTDTATDQMFFKSALKLNDKGAGRWDDMLTVAKREDWTREKLVANISFVFGLKGRRLTSFINRNLGA